MLSRESFVDFILRGPDEGATPAPQAPAESALPDGFEGFDAADTQPPPAKPGSSFARRLLEASGFGYAEMVQRDSVIRSTDVVARYLPERVSFWPKTTSRPYQTLLFEAELNHKQLLAIPAFKSRKMAHLDIVEDALARLVSEALEGFQRGGEGVTADVRKGRKKETLCVVSILDGREDESAPVRLVCFGTQNRSTSGLETFQITEQTKTWDAQLAREHLALVYERQFKKLGKQDWQEAFTTTEERKQADKLLAVCTRKAPKEPAIQESVLDLLDTIAKGFGLRKKPKTERRLQAFELPADHDIGIDPEERESSFGGKNPFGGVTLRDERSRLLGYIVYPLKCKTDASRLREHLAKNNRFHNVLVVYPDEEQASLELWQGQQQLNGKLRKGQGYKDAADVVNLLSRFFVVSKATVRNPTELAQELAYRARYLRRLAVKQLEDEPEKGPLRNLYNAFREALVHDQTEDEFADAFAQTITYGLLAARWTGNDELMANGERLTRQTALKHLHAASPFLNDLFKSALLVKLDEQRGRLLWLVDDIADLLDRIDVTDVFGKGDKDSDTATDPVIHFYEPFLAAYDKDLKDKRGVFFTPRPVVSYIVRSIHELLQKEFGLEDGLASTDTWGDVATRTKGIEVPAGVRASDPFVCILDPATGTGTFLFECIEVIERTMKGRWCRELKKDPRDPAVVSRWEDYVPNHLLPRLYGFELMMASYSAALLKLSFKLSNTGYHPDRATTIHVHLTNTLEPSSDSGNQKLAGLFGALARESREVDQIKRSKRFTVLIGNPPYSEASANSNDWIESLMERYKGSIRTEEAQIKAVSNDYVKFLCYADDAVRRSGAGIFGMITGNGYLDGRLFRDMRSEWLRYFSSIDIVNLHGSLRRGDGSVEDENVFDIMQGVAIVIGSRSPFSADSCYLTHRDLQGTRRKKYLKLQSGSLGERNKLSPEKPLYLFVPSNQQEAALEDWSLSAAFGTGNPKTDRNVTYAGGFKTRQDSFTVGFEEAELVARIRELADNSISEATLRKKYRLCSTAHFEFPRAREAARAGRLESKIRWLRYRPFDDRPMIWAREVLCEPQIEVTRHLLQPNLCLVTSRVVKDDAFAHVSVARGPVEVISLSSSTSTNAYMFPLYRYVAAPLEIGKDQRVVNLSSGFLESLQRTTGLDWSESGSAESNPAQFGPEDVVSYIYALFHSVGYRQWYGDALLRDFPVVPLPASGELFIDLARLGSRLVSYHLMEQHPPKTAAVFIGAPASAQVERVSYSDGVIWLNRSKDAGIQGVSEPVWRYKVGGYPVLEKWLKSRRRRSLSQADIEHFIRVVAVLEATMALSAAVEASLTFHGGWPGAFVEKVAGGKE